MEMTKQERLNKLLDAYAYHYDIERDVTVEGGSFPAAATYYLRDENYLITRRHVLNAVENYDYTYFYLTDELDEEIRKSRSTSPCGQAWTGSSPTGSTCPPL